MSDDSSPRVSVQKDGPYVVRGDIELRRKSPLLSEEGEPLTWRTGDELDTRAVYSLCRCGGSANKPFCDGTHARIGFDGTETAPTDDYADRAKSYPGEGIEMRDDRPLCVHAGFCTNRDTSVWKMSHYTEDIQTRTQMIGMIEHCPSGALTEVVDGQMVEPDLPIEVALVADGPIWLTGGVPVERSDGEPFETRNRVTLCRCGASSNKPLCDGTHAEIGFTD